MLRVKLWVGTFVCLLVGGLVVAGGLAVYLGSPRVSGEPEARTVAAALALLVDDDPHYVALPASVDPALRLYRTGVEAPAYVRCTPAEVRTLVGEAAEPRETWKALLGCPVQVIGNFSGVVITDETWSEVKDGNRRMRERRLLAQVEGAGGPLWILSYPFKHGPGSWKILSLDDHKIKVASVGELDRATEPEEAWLAPKRFSGRLTRLADLARNGAFVDSELGDLQAGGSAVPGGDWRRDSYVLITRRASLLSSYYRSQSLVALAGSNGRLFFKIDEDQQPGHLKQVSGVLRRMDSAEAAGVLRTLGRLGGPLGVIQRTSPEAYNAFQGILGEALIWLGVVVLIPGGILLLILLVTRKKSSAGAGDPPRRRGLAPKQG